MSSNEPPSYPHPEGEDGPAYPGQEPTPLGGQAPQPPPQPPGPPSPPGYGPPPPGYQQPVGVYSGGQQNQKALWSMILGILSLVCCGLFTGIPAIILGHMGKNEIDRAPGQTGRGMAQAGFIMGIIGTVLSVVGVVIYAVIIAEMISSGEFSDPTF